MIILIVIAAVVGSLCAASVVYLLYRMFRGHLHVGWYGGDEIRWESCLTCNGWGDVALQWNSKTKTTEWMAIPADGTFESMTFPLSRANTKACPNCLGLGHKWVGRDEGPPRFPDPLPR